MSPWTWVIIFAVATCVFFGLAIGAVYLIPQGLGRNVVVTVFMACAFGSLLALLVKTYIAWAGGSA